MKAQFFLVRASGCHALNKLSAWRRELTLGSEGIMGSRDRHVRIREEHLDLLVPGTLLKSWNAGWQNAGCSALDGPWVLSFTIAQGNAFWTGRGLQRLLSGECIF